MVKFVIKFFRYETNNNNTSKPTRPRLISRSKSEENIVIDIGKDALSVQGIQAAMSNITTAVTNPSENGTNSSDKQSDTLKRNFAFSERRDRGSEGIPKAPEDEFIFSVPRNHHMSPYIAPDEILRQFPKTNILTALTDPCIDDCVEFAKKLRSLNVDVQLDIVGALNHGFLNFAHVSCYH
jgi:hormone-sensitive lipase